MSGFAIRRQTGVVLIALVVLLGTVPMAVQAASMEIWPSERRANNTFFCYGNDWNWMLLSIYPEDWGKHRLDLPDEFVEPTVLTVTLPEAVGFLGANIMRADRVVDGFDAESVTLDGGRYR